MIEQEINDDIDEIGKKVFTTATFLALTIGIPFCLFKFLFGVLAVRVGENNQVPVLTVFGYVIIFWSILDFLMNIVRIVMNLRKKECCVEYCSIAQFGRLFKRPSLFLCIDTMISFLIICFVLWSGWIVKLNQYEAYVWYAATTVNLVSLSLMNIWTELKDNSDQDKEKCP